MVRVPRFGLELKLDQAEKRYGNDRPALDVHAMVAYVASDDAGEAGRAALVFPGQPSREADAPAFDRTLVDGTVRAARGWSRFHVVSPYLDPSALKCYQALSRMQRRAKSWWVRRPKYC